MTMENQPFLIVDTSSFMVVFPFVIVFSGRAIFRNRPKPRQQTPTSHSTVQVILWPVNLPPRNKALLTIGFPD